MKKNSELEVGDIIEVPVPHTVHVTKHVITRVTATQYITSTRKFNKQLKVLGTNGKYPVYGQQPKAIEPVAEPVKAEPVGAVVTVDVTAETETTAPAAPKLTDADYVVVFKNPEQANEVAYVAANYNRAAILVRNLEGETHIIKAFETKKAAIEAKKDGSVNSQLSVVTRNDSTHNVNFYNIIGAANAISGSGNDVLVETDHPTKQHLKGVFGKIYAKIAASDLVPAIKIDVQETVEIVDKPIDRLPECVQVCGRSGRNHDAEKHVVLDSDNALRKVELASFNALISIESAQDIVRFAKSGRYVYAPIQSIDESERYDVVSHYVLFSTVNRVIAKKTAWDDKTDLTEACKLIEIRKDETFVFEELDCEAVTYAATVDAQWIMHPNGQWKIYFHDERPEDASDCSQFEFDGWDLNGDEYRIEFGFGDNDENRDERIVWRVYAKDIVWDGKTRDLVCICRHPDALPEDDMGYKRPVASKPAIVVPWLKTESKEYEYGY